MKIVFIGASKFGLRCLETIEQLCDVDIAGIVTNPQTFTISYAKENGVKNVLHTDFKPFAEAHQIPVVIMEHGMSDPGLIQTIRDWAPDFILVVGWYHMVPKAIREIAPTGGLHASLLPDYSGGAPLVWAIINDEKETGITFFLMDAGVDSGPIIGQKAEPILPDDTIATLYDRIEERGIELLKNTLPRIAGGAIEYQVQDESKRRIFPQRSPADGLINWQLSARQIYNFIRAQTRPYPGAFTYLSGEKLSIWRSRVLDAEAEKSIITDERLSIVCTDGKLLEITQLSYLDNDYSGEEFRRKFGPLTLNSFQSSYDLPLLT